MNLTPLFETIESLPFMIQTGPISGFRSFFEFTREQPVVQQLTKAAATQEGLSRLSDRVKYLCAQPIDPRGPHLQDTALAVYLDILYDLDKTLAKEVAALVYPLPATYWSYGISQAILAQDETQAQVGE